MHDDIKAAAKLPFPAKVDVKVKDDRAGLKKKLKIRPAKGRVNGRNGGR